MSSNHLDRYSPTAGEKAFIQGLEKLLERGDRGTLAELRRLPTGAGLSAVLAGPIGRLLPAAETTNSWDEDDYLLVGSLFALTVKDPQKASSDEDVNLGGTIGRYLAQKPEEERTGVERRFRALLGASREALPEYLRALLSLIPERPVNWAQLLHDLKRWSHPDGWGQRRWARSYRFELAPKLKQTNLSANDQDEEAQGEEE
jgi:CRISPR type I-E-associated protein CasB/Cse2